MDLEFLSVPPRISDRNFIPVIHTIGHGRRPPAYFIELLARRQIALARNALSADRSRRPQYNGPALADARRQQGIEYEHLPECGSKAPAAPSELASELDRIMELAAGTSVAIMCP
jgi:uncharacterized protein (DUF488 family)